MRRFLFLAFILASALLFAEAPASTPNFNSQFFFEDTQSTLSGVNLAARRLISLNHVDVIFTPYSGEANIVAPICDHAGIIHFSNCWNANMIEKSKFSFTLSVSFKNYSEAVAQLLRQQHITRIAFAHNTDWVDGTNWFIDQCKKLGIEIVDNEDFNHDIIDFRTPILKMQQGHPQMYVLYLEYPAQDIFLKQLRELSPSALVTGYLDLCENRSLIEGATYVSEYPPIPSFYTRYKARFGVSAEQTLAPNAYDSYRILAKVAAELPAWSVQAAADKIRTTKDFPGITGSLTCAPTGVFLSKTHLVKIVNGQKVFLEE